MMSKKLPVIDAAWTLFLDRDGVINYEKVEDYIHHWDEFRFYPKAPESIATLSNLFGKTIVVTNQKGIGKGVTVESDVRDIHTKMKAAIMQHGGKIDAVYYCPATDANDPCRKPNIGMAVQAKDEFGSVDFNRSIMVGNNPSDMQFGRRAGMITILLTTTRLADTVDEQLVDFVFSDLAAVAAAFTR